MQSTKSSKTISSRTIKKKNIEKIEWTKWFRGMGIDMKDINTKQESKQFNKRKEDAEQFAKYLGLDYDDYIAFYEEKVIDFDDYSK